MKNKVKTFKEDVARILFRDYVEENERSRSIVESVLKNCAMKKYLKKGYSEEAVAQEIYEKNLLEYKEEPG